MGSRPARSCTLLTISAAHFVSHFHILAASAFPFLRTALDVDLRRARRRAHTFTCVGSRRRHGILWPIRVGPRRLLVAGLAARRRRLHVARLRDVRRLAPGRGRRWLRLGNSVYHPADYAILADAMSEHRMGRAFSIHTFAGLLGGALTPVVLFGLIAYVSFTASLAFAALLGPAVAVALLLMPPTRSAAAVQSRKAAAAGQGTTAGLLTPAILSLTGFFVLMALSNVALQNFSVVSLMETQGLTLTAANWALTAYLALGALGVLAGGSLADRTQRHGEVAAAGFGVAAVVILLMTVLSLPAPALVVGMGLAGFLGGMMLPSRDMLVRKAAPPGAAGRVFGIVSTGFNIGGIVGPLVFGWIMDHGEPRWIFGASVIFILVAALFTLASDRKPARNAVRSPAE